MNRLPEHRSAMHGRTWGRSWSPADMDPIQHYPSHGRHWSDLAMVLVAVVLAALIFVGMA